MHINIPITEEVQDILGGRFVLYSVYLEGFLLFKVRYNDLHLWDEKIQRVFGNRLPAFPPKYYLAMTESMAEERRLQLENYLQQLVSNVTVSRSEIFMEFFKKLQLKTYKIATIKIILKVYLPDGKVVKVNVETSDTAERVLEAALYKLGLSRELMEYFSLFLTHRDPDGNYSVLKRIAGFELPFVTICSVDDDDHFQLDIRKWYMKPSMDAMLMGCTAAINLLYIQALQDIEMNWARPTEEQHEKLQHLIKTDDQIKFLELMQDVQHYGYIQLAPCTSDYPEPGTAITLSVGNSGMIYSFGLSNGQTENIHIHINSLKCWHVKLLKSEKTGTPAQYRQAFTFQYRQGDLLTWISIHTEQAFLLSSSLKKIQSEQPQIRTKEELSISEKPTTSKVREKFGIAWSSNKEQDFNKHMWKSSVK